MLVARVTNEIEKRHPAAGKCRVRILYGSDAGAELALPAVGVVVGADAACDVVLADPAASAKHLTIVPRNNGFEVTDLGSKNGTFLDGVAVTKALVPVGTTLRVGSTLVQLLPGEETVEIPPSAATSFGAMVGASLAMRQIYAVLERASRSDAPVLFLGESGTGKELAARAVHDASPRMAGPFVVFDCGAASDTLIESDLFGHVRGAYTGAHGDRAGAFALAHQGTLFLDEIGDLPLALQPKLLRMLESGEVTPLGSRKTERYDVRVVAATHRDLWAEVGRGTFRGDLYYRLAVVEVHLPPLRRRTGDVPELVRVFLRKNGFSDAGVGGPGLERLLAYGWPGNVRELRNVITRAVALAPTGAAFASLPLLLRAGAAGAAAEAPLGRADVPYHDAKASLLARFEKEYLADLLRRAEGNLSQAARIAGLERKYLYKVLERADMLPERLRKEGAGD
jgi:DNA-binding NtrC family response regulator